MSKSIRVFDEITGEIEFDEQVDGGYSIQYTKNTDSGQIYIHGKINNGRYGEKHWIKNAFYGPTAQRLISKFEELKHINASRILFIEDTEFEDKGTTKDKWIARSKKANKELEEVWGYWYVIETRGFYIEKLTDNQLAALIYHELRHIDRYGDIKKHDIEDWSNMVDTLGKNWAEEQRRIDNILDDGFKWVDERRKQITLAEYQDQGQRAAK